MEALVGFHVSGFLEEMIVSELCFCMWEEVETCAVSHATSSQTLMDKELNQQSVFKHWLTRGLLQYCNCINATY